MFGVILVVGPLIGAALVIMGMLRDEENQKVRMKRLRPDRYGLSRAQLSRITADVLRRDRRRARYGWQA